VSRSRVAVAIAAIAAVWDADDGQAFVEYALLLTLITLAIVGLNEWLNLTDAISIALGQVTELL
jgi:Flp pilus assembly pilin Flp